MTKYGFKKIAGTGVLSVGLVLGMAGFAGASSGTIDTTGAQSNNEIRHRSRVDLRVDNDNTLNLQNRTTQRSESGDTSVRFNTTGGTARTGSATNDNVVDAWVEIDNSGAVGEVSAVVDGAGAGSDTARIENTGYQSNNEVSFNSEVDVDVYNDNVVTVDNAVSQTATSGNASVEYNTTGGDAVSGNVSNTSESLFTISISN